jgi:uncharacterized RDD family membrane protein YckC
VTNTDTVDPSLIGHYAGAVTRLAAIAGDVAFAIVIFNLTAAVSVWLLDVFTSYQIDKSRDSLWWLVPLVCWLFLYFWYCYTLSGKTPAMALLGLRVVRGDGSDLDGWHAALRTITLPLGFLMFGLGYIGIVFGRKRRGLQDVIADTAVVYDFDARAARLRFLMRTPIDHNANKR